MQTQTTPAGGLDDRRISAIRPSKEQQNRLRSHLATAKLGSIVTLMLGSPRHRALSIGQLRQTAIPALLRDQIRIGEASRQSGETAPVALVMWAKVSEEVHERLLAEKDQALRLAPEEWDGGERYWIVDAIGDERYLAPLIRELRKTSFAGKAVHYRVRSEQGVEVKLLDAAPN